MNTHALSRPEPLPFHFEPAGEALLSSSRELIEVTELIPAAPRAVFDVFDDVSQSWRWLPGFLGAHFHTANTRGEGATFDEVFSFMTIRMRVLRADPGREWLATCEGCTLPVGSSLVQRISLLDACGRTRVRWQVAVDLTPPLKPLYPAIAPLFQALFTRGLENLARLDWPR